MKQLDNLGKIVSAFFLFSVLALVINLKGCFRNENLLTKLEPLKDDLDVPFINFEFDALKDTTIRTETGTTLTFLAGTFTNKEGEIVKGKVQLRVREFHDPIQILRSGIPMRLRSDRNKFLQSAGMIEIHAFQSGQELEVSKGKSVSTDLASFRSSKDHQLYFLKNNNDWVTGDTFTTKPNLHKQLSLKRLLGFKAKNESNKKESNDIIFELYGDEDQAPELDPWRGQKWRIPGKNVTEDVHSAFRVNWDSVKVIRVNEGKLKYKLSFWKTMYQSSENSQVTKQFLVEVTPWSEKESKRDLALTMKNRFLRVDTVKKEIEAEMIRLKKEADLVNSFKVNKMGIWNIDRAIKLSDFTPVKATFDFQSSLKKSQNVRLFCVLRDDNSVVDFPNWQKEPIYLSAERSVDIIALLPSGDIAYVSYDQIQIELRKRTGYAVFNSKKGRAEQLLSFKTDL